MDLKRVFLRWFMSFFIKGRQVKLLKMKICQNIQKYTHYYAFDLFSKFTWVIFLNDEKSISFSKVFQEILNESSRKPRKIWRMDKGIFCNR